MANTIQIKRSSTSGNTPTLAAGELGVNLADSKLYVGNGSTNVLLNPTASTNADTVDSLHADSFLRSDASDTYNCNGNVLSFDFDGDRNSIQFSKNGYNRFVFQHTNSGNDLDIQRGGSNTGGKLKYAGNEVFTVAGGILTNTSQPVLKTAYNADHYLGIGHHYIDLNFSSYNNDLELRTGGTPRLTIHRSTGNATFSGTITATGGDLTGTLNIGNTGDEKIVLKNSNNPYVMFQQGTTNKGFIQWNAAYAFLEIANSAESTNLRLDDTLQLSLDGGSYYDVLTSNTGLLKTGGTLTGNLNANGLVSGVWSGNGTFRGIFHSAQTGSEYCLISNDTNTILSASTGYGVFIRGGNNVSTYQIGVYPNQLPTAGGNTILTTASGLQLTGGTLTGDLTIAHDSTPTLLLRANTVDSANSGKISFRENSGGTTGADIRYNGATNKLIFDTSDVSNALVLDRVTGALTVGSNLGINGSSATDPLSVKGESANDYVARFYRSDNGNTLVDVFQDSSNHGHLFVRNSSGLTKVKLFSAGVSYFRGGNLEVDTRTDSNNASAEFTVRSDVHASVVADRNANTNSANFMLRTAGVNKWRLSLGMAGSGNETFSIYDEANTANVLTIAQGGATTFSGTVMLTGQLTITENSNSGKISAKFSNTNTGTGAYQESQGWSGAGYWRLGVANENYSSSVWRKTTWLYSAQGSLVFGTNNSDRAWLTTTSFYPSTSGHDLGTNAQRWQLYATSGDVSGNLTVAGSCTFAALSGTTADFSGSVEVGGALDCIKSGTNVLTIQGSSSGYVNAGISLRATSDTHYRGLGVFMHDAGGDTEWFAGRPYADSDKYIIARKASQASHSTATAQTSNSLFTIASTGAVTIGATLTVGDTLLTAGGSDANLRLRSDSSRSGLFIDKPGTTTVMGSALVLASDESYRLGTQSYYHVVCQQGGGTLLYYQGNTKLTTTSYGADITGRLVTTSHIDAPDNARIRLGDGDDLQLYHDGTNSYIDNNTGQLFLNKNGPSNVWLCGGEGGILNADGSEYMLRATNNGSVKLYYDNAIKFETLSNGAKVTQYLYGSDGEILAGQDSGGYYFAGGAGQNISKPVFIGDNASYIKMKVGDAERFRVTTTGATVTGNLSVIYNGSASVRTYNGVLKSDFLENSAGANHLTIRTESGGNKNVIIDPDGTGYLNVKSWSVFESSTNFASIRLKSTAGEWDIDNDNGLFALEWAGGDKLTLSNTGNLWFAGYGAIKQIVSNAYATADLNNWYTGSTATFGQFYRYDSTHGHFQDAAGNVAANAPNTLTQSPVQIYSYGALLTLGTTNSFRGQFYMAHSDSEIYWRSGWGSSGDQNWTRLVGDRNIQSVINNVGNISIGGAPSANGKLTIHTGTNTNGLLIYEDTDDSLTHNLYIDGNDQGVMDLRNNSNAVKVQLHSGGHSFFTGGSLGINTTVPAYELEVQGSISNYGDGKIIRLRSNDYIIGQIENKGTGADYDKGYFRLFDTGTAKVVLDSAGTSSFRGGSLAIGTATASAKLHVANSASSGGTFKFTDGSSRTLMDLGGGILSWNAGSVMGAGSWAGTADHQFQTLTTSRSTVQINGPASGTNHALYVTGLQSYFSGSVGIGGIDPDQKLEVWGAIKSAGPYGFYAGRAVGTWSSFGTGVPTILLRGDADNSRAGAIHFQEFDGNTTSAIYSTDGTDGYGFVMSAYQGDIKFATGSLAGTKMTIANATGNVSIGSTSSAYGRLFVDAATNAASTALAIRGRDSSANYIALNVINNADGELFSILNNGRAKFVGAGVGINKTPNSQYDLDMAGQMLVGSHMSFKAVNTLQGIGFNRNVHTGAIYSSSNFAYQIHSNANYFEIQRYNGSGTFLGYALTCNDSGNIGIGVQSGSAKLHVAGSAIVGRTNAQGSYANDDYDLFVGNGNSGTTILLYNNASNYHSGLIKYDANCLKLGLNNNNSADSLLTTTAVNITSTGVGIGVTPAATLHVQSSSPEFRLSTASSNVVRLRTSGDNYINTGQNLGLGTASPSAKLEVNGTLAVTSGATLYAATFSRHGSGLTFPDIYDAAGNGIVIGHNSSTAMLRVNSTGVGIGGTPSANLHIVGSQLGQTLNDYQRHLQIQAGLDGNTGHLELKDVRTSAWTSGNGWTTSGRRLQMKIDSHYMGYIQWNGTGNNYGMSFGTGYTTSHPGNVTEAMRIDSSQRVGIGCTPTFKFQVNGDVRVNSGSVFLDDTQPVRWGGTKAKIVGSNGGDYIKFYTDATERLTINSDGNCILDGNLYFNSTTGSFINQDSSNLRLAGDNGVKLQTYSGGWQNRLVIADDGDIDIAQRLGVGGTHNNSYQLYVTGTSYFNSGSTHNPATLYTSQSTGGNYLLFNNASGQLGYVGWGSTGNNDLYIVNQGGSNTGSIRLHAGSTTKVLVASDGDTDITGRLGVGGAHSDSYQLYVNGTSYFGNNIYGADADYFAVFGRARVGYIVGHGDFAGFAHRDQSTTTNYALIQSSIGDTFVNSASGKSIFFRQNNSDTGIINGSQNWGIGTIYPGSYKLYVNGPSYFTASGTSYAGHFKSSQSATPYVLWCEEPTSPTAGYPLLTVTNSGGSSTYFRVDSGGSVNIGSSKLKIGGSSGSNGQVLTTDGSGGISWTTVSGSGSGTVNETHAAGTEHEVAVHLGSSTVGEGHKLIYNSSSGLTVNSTSSETDSTYALYVSGGIKNSTGGLYVTGDGYISSRLGVATSVDTSYGIKVAGYIASYGHTTWSDYRLKDNTTLWNTSEAATLVKDVPVYSYRWNDNCEAKSVQDQDRIGFLAHEVSEKINKNNLVINEKDGEKYQSVNQTDMIPILWAALQDALKRIEELEAK